MKSSHYREERSPNNGSLDRCGTAPIRDDRNQPFHQASPPYVEEIIGPIHMFFKYGRFGGSPLDYDCFIGDESDTELTSEMLVNLEFRGYNMWCKDIGDGG